MNAATMNLYGVTPLTAREMRAVNGGEGTNAVQASTNTVQQVASTNPPPAAAKSDPLKEAQAAADETMNKISEFFRNLGDALRNVR